MPLKPLLKKLIRFESTQDKPKEKEKILEFADNWFKKRNIDSKIHKSKKADPYLLSQVKGQKKKSILFLGHLDVVPASKEMFDPKEKNNKIFGRGAIDDKGPVAILMLLMEKIKKNPKDFPNVYLALTTDEESGGMGAEELSEQKKFKKMDAVFVPDGGDLNEVVYKAKGAFHLLLKIKGKAAHGSMPWKGENAADKAIEIYQKIRNYFKNENLNVKNHWHSTVNLGIIKSGDAINKVPDKAILGIDIRFTQKHELNRLVKDIKKIIKGKAEIKKTVTGNFFSSQKNNPLILKYVKAMEETIGKKIKLTAEHGASDARFFSQLDIPIWLHYPKGGNYHAKNEWVEIDSLKKMSTGLEKFLKKI